MTAFFLACLVASGELHADGPYFRDRQSAVHILRGVNATGDAKLPPFMPLRSASQLDAWQSWGLNVVRLLFIWEAYEPEPGNYNDAYLEYIARVSTWARERDIYTIVDFHQDSFARVLLGGCGEGFPAWAIAAGITQHMPDNGERCASWPARTLFDGGLKAAWQGFYANANDARAHFLEMARRVSARMANIPGVIGYDLLNEPLGNEDTDLMRLYEHEAHIIRTVDASAILFVSPRAAVSVGLATGLVKPSFHNVAYSPHYYDTLVVGLKMWIGHMLFSPFDTMLATAQSWNVPLFVGEFGTPVDAWHASSYMNTVFRRMNEHFVSGAQWTYSARWTPAHKDGWNGEDFSIVDDAGTPRANFRARPYAQRIAGTPQKLTIDREGDTCYLELRWDHEPAQGETRLFAPEHAFCGPRRPTLQTRGTNVLCSYDGTWVRCTSYDRGEKVVRVTD